jgi:hypothetical protein
VPEQLVAATCGWCGAAFTFDAQHYAQERWHQPRNCPPCRDAARIARELRSEPGDLPRRCRRCKADFTIAREEAIGFVKSEGRGGALASLCGACLAMTHPGTTAPDNHVVQKET